MGAIHFCPEAMLVSFILAIAQKKLKPLQVNCKQ
jgi:hypothetical protein